MGIISVQYTNEEIATPAGWEEAVSIFLQGSTHTINFDKPGEPYDPDMPGMILKEIDAWLKKEEGWNASRI